MRDEHVKVLAQDMTQDVAEGLLGAAEDGSPSASGGIYTTLALT